MEDIKELDAATLNGWLQMGKEVSILDIRPIQQRSEWYIPNSVYFNAYDKLQAKDPDALKGLYLDKSKPVVTLCAGGRMSRMAAEMLQKQGYETYSLAGGMKGWSMSWNTARITFPNFKVIQFRRTGKGCLSYMIVSNDEGIAVDASLPVEVYAEIIAKENIKLKYVLDTHIHADHLSRSRLLAEEFGATLYLPTPNNVQFSFKDISKEVALAIGDTTVRAISTPGHTIESTCYLVGDEVLLTGDTIFINGVGRPDLKADNDAALEKSKLLFQSIKKLTALNEEIIVLPGHTSEPVAFDNIPVQTTIGDFKKSVPMVLMPEAEFTKTILQKIPATPPNYLMIVEKNLSGDFADINPIDVEAGANRCAIS